MIKFYPLKCGTVHHAEGPVSKAYKRICQENTSLNGEFPVTEACPARCCAQKERRMPHLRGKSNSLTAQMKSL